MRASEITKSTILSEATNVNVNILKEITKQILDKIPDFQIYPQTYNVHGKELDLTKLETDYPDFKPFFDHFKETEIKFMADAGREYSWGGIYIPRLNTVVINVYRIIIQSRMSRLNKYDNSDFSIKVVLFHELRHVMQHVSYRDYYFSDKRINQSYAESDIEIDAVWNSLVAAWMPSKDLFINPNGFANKVMKSLTNYKTLTPKQKKHYHRKTLAYWYNPELFLAKDTTKEGRIESLVFGKIKNKVLNGINSANSLGFDMRTVMPYYDWETFGRFLFPVQRFRNIFDYLRGETKDANETIKFLFYFIPALYIDNKSAKLLKSYIIKKHDVRVEDITNNLDKIFPRDFDIAAIRNFLFEKYNIQSLNESNSKNMRAKEFINEAKFRKPITVFHGTSSKFLRSILKKGIDPAPEEKVWRDDPDASIDRPSRASVGGSYWTSNILTARSSANNSKRKFGGNRLFVIAQIAEGSSYADEDQVSWQMSYSYKFAVNQLVGGIYPNAIHLYIDIFYDDPTKKKQFVDIFAKEFHHSVVQDSQIPIPTKILEEMCMAIALRYIAYTVEGKGGLYSWGNESLFDKLFQNVKNKPDSVPSIQEAEQNYLTAMGKVTRYYRKLAQYSSANFSHTLRTEQQVSFGGANKITHILELKEDADNEEYFVLHYGSKNSLPSEFKAEYQTRIGKIPPIKVSPKLNESDKIITEVPLPPDWDKEEMTAKKGTTFKSRVAYAVSKSPKLGAGSSRVVVKIEEGGKESALKIAKNRKGTAQNIAEIDLLGDGYIRQMGIVIPMIDHDESDTPVWVQTELARVPKNEKELCDYIGCSELKDLIKYAAGFNTPSGYKTQQRIIKTVTPEKEEIFIDYAQSLAELAGFDVKLGDFVAYKNWGFYNGKPVIIDIGLTKDVAKLYPWIG